MLTRCLAAMIAVVLAAGTAAAADIRAETVTGDRRENCSAFGQIFLWGDPRDCPDDETVPACDSDAVVSAAIRFADRAQPVYREPRVTEFQPVRELTDTFFNPSPLVRRYCLANVSLDNGDHTEAYYFVEEDAGFVGLSWKVYVCILGYDRWRVYDGRCRVARPATQF